MPIYSLEEVKKEISAIISADTSYNKSAIKMMRLKHPELWDEILFLTYHLPKNILPKQRIWHIMNDCYEIPKCPITGEEVKWFENRYLTFKNQSAKMKHLHKSGVLNNNTSAVKIKRTATYKNGLLTGRIKRPPISQESIDTRVRHIKETCMQRYGVDNPSRIPGVSEKIS